jgi:predicted nucleic acid-binding protein
VPSKSLVLDANILIRAVLGRRVRGILEALGTLVEQDLYAEFEAEARKRLGTRDPDDWPILAAALALRCPIWTEDADFFGCGVATWTSARIHVFLDQPPAS